MGLAEALLRSVVNGLASDPETAQTIKRLARNRGASQAEVIRRAVRLAAEQDEREPVLTPAEVVACYQANPSSRTWDEAKRLIAKMRKERRRRLKADAIVAATAIRARASFATFNVSDFTSFVPHGLDLLDAT